MDKVKKYIIAFGNACLQFDNEELILNSFASRYIDLKKIKNTGCEEYQLLNTFFKSLGLIPEKDEKGNISYKEIKIKETNIDNKLSNKEKDFFKKRGDKRVGKVNRVCKGEKNLVNDILFDLSDEIFKLICFL